MQLAIWEGDLNQYVLEEGDESFEFSVRLNAQHVLQEISSNFGPAAAEAISTAAHATVPRPLLSSYTSLMAVATLEERASERHTISCRM